MQSHTVSLVCLNSFEIIGASSLFWVKTLVKTLATKKKQQPTVYVHVFLLKFAKKGVSLGLVPPFTAPSG